MSWATRAAKNILPYSAEKIILQKALKEWFYTGQIYDTDEASETCELCDHPNIRYQFTIKNINNSNELYIGSECITKFNIKVYDDNGFILNKEESKTKIREDKRNFITDQKKKNVINSLISLSKVDDQFEIENFIKYYHERDAFTPNQLSLLFWRFEKFNISFQKNNFKMTIKKKREREQLYEMEEWKRKKIEACMTPSQRKHI